MSTDAAIDADAPPELEGETKSGKFKLIAIIAGIMIGEAVLFLVLFGGGGDPAPAAEDEGTEVSSEEELVEVSLDKIACTNSLAAPGTVINLTVELSALVGADQESDFQQAATKQYAGRIRDACLTVLRSASLEDLSDPEAITLKRQLREQINKVLRKSTVREIIISNYEKNEA